jgi:hypothetical protein
MVKTLVSACLDYVIVKIVRFSMDGVCCGPISAWMIRVTVIFFQFQHLWECAIVQTCLFQHGWNV